VNGKARYGSASDTRSVHKKLRKGFFLRLIAELRDAGPWSHIDLVEAMGVRFQVIRREPLWVEPTEVTSSTWCLGRDSARN